MIQRYIMIRIHASYVLKISAFWILFFLYPVSAQENGPFAESNRNSNPSVLFIGNSFTYGACSAVQFYRTDFVTDLNRNGWGGVPALFKAYPMPFLDSDLLGCSFNAF